MRLGGVEGSGGGIPRLTREGGVARGAGAHAARVAQETAPSFGGLPCTGSWPEAGGTGCRRGQARAAARLGGGSAGLSSLSGRLAGRILGGGSARSSLRSTPLCLASGLRRLSVSHPGAWAKPRKFPPLARSAGAPRGWPRLRQRYRLPCAPPALSPPPAPTVLASEQAFPGSSAPPCTEQGELLR